MAGSGGGRRTAAHQIQMLSMSAMRPGMLAQGPGSSQALPFHAPPNFCRYSGVT